jgi:hypothetical protein
MLSLFCKMQRFKVTKNCNCTHKTAQLTMCANKLGKSLLSNYTLSCHDILQNDTQQTNHQQNDIQHNGLYAELFI